jgi:hypothetical protein
MAIKEYETNSEIVAFRTNPRVISYIDREAAKYG